MLNLLTVSHGRQRRHSTGGVGEIEVRVDVHCQANVAVAHELLGGGVLTGSAWWVISGVFNLRTRLVALEGQIELLKAEIAGVHTRCHGREVWLREISTTVTRTDKNVVRLAAKMDVEIEE